MGIGKALTLAAALLGACPCARTAEATNGPSGPSQAFVSLAVSVLGASMASDDYEHYVKAGKVLGAMRESGEDCLKAGPGDCVVEADGVSIGFGNRRHSVTLRAAAGYAARDILVAVEDARGLRIVDPDAYLYALETRKVRSVQAYLAMCAKAF